LNNAGSERAIGTQLVTLDADIDPRSITTAIGTACHLRAISIQCFRSGARTFVASITVSFRRFSRFSAMNRTSSKASPVAS
jgi:hypothetical protein